MNSKTREIIFLLAYLFIFAALFLIALYDFHRGESMVNLGFEPKTTSIIMMILSLGGAVKTLYHIYRFETEK